MQFYDVVESRTSIKKFKNTPIDNTKLDRMVNAAMMSPSWKNNTSYKFILVNDKLQKEQLSRSIMNNDNTAATAVTEAPLVAVVVADPKESGEVADRQYYLVDSAIALEHFVLAATNEGYGTCWIAAIDEYRIRNILNIPKDYRVVAMTPVGEIAEQKEHYTKKDATQYVFMNGWNNSYTTENNKNLQQNTWEI